MISFEEAGLILDKAIEELPQGIFDELNGGVNLLPASKTGEDGRYVMGLYHHDQMGRYIEIFYGSLTALYSELSDEKFSKKLISTMHHELTHHVESLAGDRSLEKWDDWKTAQWLESGPIYTNSVLFVDGSDTDLAPAAEAMFRAMAAERCPEVRSASAGMEAGTEAASAEAIKAAAELGADIYAHRSTALNREMLESYDAVLCMTLEQADDLADMYPDMDEKFMCLGESDIRPPRFKRGWAGAMRRIKTEVESLIEELCMEDEA